jgi:ribosomal protein S18 acetylase RimI-like enzyme
MLAPGGVVAVGTIGSEVLGTMAIYLPPDTGQPMLVAAWVAPAARGRGVGDALVAEVLDWCQEQGYEQVELRVVETNEPARRLFLRNGFVPTGEREPLESDPTVDTEFMVRKLS